MKVGFFGKLPGYGDFVQRNVSADLITHWDNWLVQAIDTSQAQLKQDWREIYFTSPIWRFSVQANIICPSTLSGLMMPSVDAAGRSYPFFVFCQPSGTQNVFAVSAALDVMHQTCEDILLSLLAKSRPDLDEIAQLLQQNYRPYSSNPASCQTDTTDLMHGELLQLQSDAELTSESALQAFTRHILNQRDIKVSIWSHGVTEQLAHTQRYFAGMPPVYAFASFLTGSSQI